MKVVVCSVTPHYDKSLRGLAVVEVLDVGIVIRGVGIHQGRNGRLWLTFPSRPKPKHERTLEREPHIYFRDGFLEEFERSVFKQVRDYPGLLDNITHQQGNASCANGR